MKKSNAFLVFLILGTVLLASCSGNVSKKASENCDVPDDIAADGSRCGDRAASIRPGGR